MRIGYLDLPPFDWKIPLIGTQTGKDISKNVSIKERFVKSFNSPTVHRFSEAQLLSHRLRHIILILESNHKSGEPAPRTKYKGEGLERR